MLLRLPKMRKNGTENFYELTKTSKEIDKKKNVPEIGGNETNFDVIEIP